MSKMTEMAAKYRIPLQSTPEDLETNMNLETVLLYENKDGLKRVLLAGHWYHPDGKSWIAAVYEFLHDDETTIEGGIGLREISEERFEHNGNAIAWAIANA